MSRGLPRIKSETLYETGSRKAMARLAKVVGTDLRKTATKVAMEAGYKSMTDAAMDWRSSDQYERVLFRDFLNQKIAERFGPGAAIPNSLTVENFGQEDAKSKVSNVPADVRLRYEAAEQTGGKPITRSYVDKDGKVIGTEIITPAMNIKLRASEHSNLLDAIIADFGDRNKKVVVESDIDSFVRKMLGK